MSTERKPPRFSPRLIRTVQVAFCFVAITFIITIIRDRHTYHDALSYSTRPLWDKPDGPTLLLPHLHAEGVPPYDAAACARHSWSLRAEPKPKLVDAFLFSTELDLLEIRLRELWNVVLTFVLVESTHSLMGEPKDLMFANNKGRFSKYESKIRHHVYHGRAMTKRDGAFTLVNEMRIGVRDFLYAFSSNRRCTQHHSLTDIFVYRSTLNLAPNTLVLMSDVDEIPSSATMGLLKACESPLPLHLQMRNFMYSFEFATDMRSWRAQLHQWGNQGTSFVHSKSTELALSDSGWHCSCCFRNLDDFVFKMKGASHADRLYNRLNWKKYIEHDHIQRKICRGEDLYDMLPEAYTWGELVQLWHGSVRLYGATNLPKAVIEDSDKFAFLLPGGCIRES